ncbi:WhiB family transcriptional regulator [Corynebacterium kroppenstedtii]|uniref:WhiB family transcriptional regulator n=1 Tax=Corynebacterium sp. PCR 32 TaxID=3351342 RepID=UPI003098016E
MLSQVHNLPAPTTQSWDWQRYGSCRNTDASLFFHPEGERGRARASRENTAKSICATCPVINRCREHALSVGETYGIWGGLSESERDTILKSRLRSRRQARTQKHHHTTTRTPVATHG